MSTTIRHPGRVIRRLAEAAPPVLARYYRPDCCIAATRVAVDALARFGLEAAPAPTDVVILNPPLRARLDGGVAPEDRAEPQRLAGLDGAGSVGIGFGAGPGEGFDPRTGYDGHLVAVCQGHLIDLTLPQASRPDREVRLSPVAQAFGPEAAGRFAAGERVWLDVNGCAVGYRRKPEAVGYRTSPDWARRRNLGIADEVVVAMNTLPRKGRRR